MLALYGIRTSIYIIVRGWGFVKGSGIGLCRMTRKFVGKFIPDFAYLACELKC